jgi:sarcosine oxidase
LDRDVTPEDEQVLRDCTSRYFPRAAGPTMTLKTCMFTNAPDGHFLIDLHPDFPQVAYASACSGHGFKFASVIGEILADLALMRQTRHNVELFSHERFLGADGAARRSHAQTAVRRHAQRSGALPSQRGNSHGEPAHGMTRASGVTRASGEDQEQRIRSPWL